MHHHTIWSVAMVVLAGCLLMIGGGCGVRQQSSAPTPTGGNTPVASVNVSDLGARGDGRTDDRSAIQAALDRAHALQIDVVFPVGRFLIASATAPGDRLLHTYPDQRLRGAGPDRTVLIVSPAIGDYVAVIGARTDSTGTGSWSLSGLAVDQEASRGATLDVPRMTVAPRMVVRLGDYRASSSVSITNSVFIDSDNVNSLYLFASRVEVSGNRFSDVGGPPGAAAHDHSTVYSTATTADGTQTITGNLFVGRRGSGGAQTAIETHGARQHVGRNTVRDYLRGMNITGVASVPTTAALVQANRLTGVAIGIQLWSEPARGTTGRNGLEAVELDGNHVTLDGRAWDDLSGVDVPTSAVLVNPTNSATVDRLRVTSNQISYQSVGTAPTVAAYNAAVSCRTLSLPRSITFLEVRGNTVRGAPLWIESSCSGDGTLIGENEVR